MTNRLTNAIRLLGQLFAPERDPYETGIFAEHPFPWQMTQKEYIESPRGRSSWLTSWETHSELDPKDPKVINEAEEKAIEYHKKAIYEALYRGDPVPEEVLADYPEFKQMQETIEGTLLSSIDLDDIRKSNHVYRGMSKEEFDTTIGQGRGIWSDKRCSFTGEGTCFAIHPRSSLYYALSGYSDPKETGNPVYLVEVEATEELMFKDHDDYVKTKYVDLWIPQENVTRIFEIDTTEDKEDYYIKEINVPNGSKTAHLAHAIKALNINKEDLHELWYENSEGEKFIPNFEEDMPDNIPEEYRYQYSQWPNSLTLSVLMMIDPEEVKNCPHPEEDIKKTYGWIDGIEGRECSLCGGTQEKNVGEDWPEEWEAYGSRELMQGHSTWPENLVLAMANSGDFTLSEAILISANACERCMNSLAHQYGLDWGYEEGSEEWQKENTECDFCRDLNSKSTMKKAQYEDEEDPFERDYVHSACHEFTIAMHKLTGLSIMILIDNETGLMKHSFVKIDDKTGIDAKGKRLIKDIAKDYFNKKAEYTIEEVDEAYIDKYYGVEEDEIETAIEYIEEKGLI